VGYVDPENDNPNPTGIVYPTLRGSTEPTSGVGGDLLGDERQATEFTMTLSAAGLPVGSFTPQGAFPGVPQPYGSRYMIYYAEAASPPVVPPVEPVVLVV